MSWRSERQPSAIKTRKAASHASPWHCQVDRAWSAATVSFPKCVDSSDLIPATVSAGSLCLNGRTFAVLCGNNHHKYKALNLGQAYHMLHARERDNQAAPSARPRPAFEAGTDGSQLPRQPGQDRGADKRARPAALAAIPESPSSAQSRRSISGRARAGISTAWCEGDGRRAQPRTHDLGRADSGRPETTRRCGQGRGLRPSQRSWN
jgi:hypothetical protein